LEVSKREPVEQTVIGPILALFVGAADRPLAFGCGSC
jgi:hypothetical protein